MNRSYDCSKSTESEILAMLAKIRNRSDKKPGYNFAYHVLPFSANQWSWPFELFHWTFCLISHFVYDRYTSYFAHFTFSVTIWPLSLSWVWRTDIMVWSYYNVLWIAWLYLLTTLPNLDIFCLHEPPHFVFMKPFIRCDHQSGATNTIIRFSVGKSILLTTKISALCVEYIK